MAATTPHHPTQLQEAKVPIPFYADDTVTLYLGDSRELIPELQLQADLIMADPPYEETGYEWDRWPTGWLTTVAPVARALWCFGGLRMFMRHAPEFTTAGWKLSHDVAGKDVEVLWEKHNASGADADRFRRIHEQAGLFYRGPWSSLHREPQRVTTGVVERGRVVKQGAKDIGHRGEYRAGGWTDSGTRLMASVIPVRSMHGRALHPTEKPIGLLDPLIRYACPPGGLVLDPFAGSGSTLDAARQAGRRAVGIEANEQYAERAALRLSQATLPAA